MVVVALVGILATLGFKTYRYQMAKARDATRVSALGQLKKILQAYEIVEKQFPSNPSAGVACSYEASMPAPFYHPDCLKEVIEDISAKALQDPLGNRREKAYDNQAHAIVYYNYGSQAVIAVTLEVSRQTLCSIPGGTMCDAGNPAHRNQVCVCIPPSN